MKIEFQKEDALIWVKAHEKEMVEDISALVRVPSVAQNGTEHREKVRVFNEKSWKSLFEFRIWKINYRDWYMGTFRCGASGR